jgi:hypothetical protein
MNLFFPCLTSYLDFETDLDDLGGGHAEIRGLRCIMANRDFLQGAMPDVLPLGITITRLK